MWRATRFADFGAKLEHHPLFPERANISLAQVQSPDVIKLRVWERGAGLTQACGTAACAATVAAARTGRAGREVAVTLPGGILDIVWRADGNIIMTGPIAFEFDGVLQFGQANSLFFRETAADSRLKRTNGR